jgi:uncharacterized iron-regulated membrane protein
MTYSSLDAKGDRSICVLKVRDRQLHRGNDGFTALQSLRIRKALFQIHLWMEIGVGIYVLAISISGSAIVYRRGLTRKHARQTVVTYESGHRMSVEELTRRAQRAYPTYEVDNIREAQTSYETDEIVLERAHERIERLFDPYTSSDLGDPHSVIEHILGWFLDLHANLLAGHTGRQEKFRKRFDKSPVLRASRSCWIPRP